MGSSALTVFCRLDLGTSISPLRNKSLNIYTKDSKYILDIKEVSKIFGYKPSQLFSYYKLPIVDDNYSYLENCSEFFNRGRKPYLKEVYKIICDKIRVSVIRASPIETDIIKNIIEYLEDDNIEYILQHKCGKYKIDMYIKTHNLAIEIDENNHSGRCRIKEKEREDFIKEKLGCKFYRINPDDINFTYAKMLKNLKKNLV